MAEYRHRPGDLCVAEPSGPHPRPQFATHAYLCRRAARRFKRPGLERSDLEQVAALGLVKACDRFDARTTTPFEAFAWLVIVGELMHYVRDHEWLVRIPRRLRKLERDHSLKLDKLTNDLGREPSDRELATEMRVDRSSLLAVRAAREAMQVVSFDDPARSIDSRCERALHAPEAVALEDQLLLDIALKGLPPYERQIIVGVYLLGMTQLEVARHLGMSARHVSRLRRIALSRMQRTWGRAC